VKHNCGTHSFKRKAPLTAISEANGSNVTISKFGNIFKIPTNAHGDWECQVTQPNTTKIILVW